MGNLYEYKCDNCGYEISYRIGRGFTSADYFDRTKKAAIQLKTDTKNVFGFVVYF